MLMEEKTRRKSPSFPPPSMVSSSSSSSPSSSSSANYSSISAPIPHISVLGCVFCEIIAKTRKADIKYEDDEFVVFSDINPQSRFHLQIVPKTHVASVNHLKTEHIPIVDRMLDLAEEVMGKLSPDSELQLSFHRPPFTSVKHLHLHCLSLPVSGCIGTIKHNPAFWWVLSAHDVLKKLKGDI